MAEPSSNKITLSPQIVTATRIATSADRLFADVTVIDHEQIIQAAGSSLTELLARQPGIEINRNGPRGGVSSVFLRGTHFNQTLVLIDGIRTGAATLGAPDWSYLPLHEIERIEILRGPASSLYGSDALGGVVQIFTKRGHKTKGFATFETGSYRERAIKVGISGSTLYTSSSQQGWRYSLGASMRQSDEYSAVVSHVMNNNSDRDGYQKKHAALRLSYQLSPDHQFGISAIDTRGWNRYDATPTMTTPWDQNWQKDLKQKAHQTTLSFFSINHLLPHWISTLRLGKSIDRTSDWQDDSQISSINTHQTQLQWQNEWQLDSGTLLAAAESLTQQVGGSVNYVKNQRRSHAFQLGYTYEPEISTPHRWQINIRTDQNKPFGQSNTGMLVYGLQLSPEVSTHASIATGFKIPSFNDLYYPDSGNPDLLPEKALNSEIGISWTPRFKISHTMTLPFQLSVNYFNNRLRDLIEWAPTSNGTWQPSNIAKARIHGLTLEGSLRAERSTIRFNLTLQDPRNPITHKQLRYRTQRFGTIILQQHHQHWQRWQWQVEWQAYGRRFSDRDNSDPIGGYSLVNLASSYRFNKRWQLNARIDNIFNIPYTMIRNYKSSGRRFMLAVRTNW